MQGRRAFRIAVAIGWLLWTGAIIPGHARGCVPLSAIGLHASAAATSRCCAGRSNEQPNREKRTPANCAICFLAVQLNAPTLPPPPRLVLVELRAVVEASPFTSHQSHPTLAYLSRGPPALV